MNAIYKPFVLLALLVIPVIVFLQFTFPPPKTPGAAVKTALAQAEKTVTAADTKLLAATVQVTHAQAVVKVKAKVSAKKRTAYEVAKSPGSGGNHAAVGDRIVAPTPELPAPETPTVETVVAAADEALDACHEENVALQEEAAALEVVITAHEDKEAALEQEGALYRALATDLEKENARLESNLFWTHVAIGVAVVVAAAGGLYLIGVF